MSRFLFLNQTDSTFYFHLFSAIYKYRRKKVSLYVCRAGQIWKLVTCILKNGAQVLHLFQFYFRKYQVNFRKSQLYFRNLNSISENLYCISENVNCLVNLYTSLFSEIQLTFSNIQFRILKYN